MRDFAGTNFSLRILKIRFDRRRKILHLDRFAFCGREDVGVELLLSLEVTLVRFVRDAHSHMNVSPESASVD